MVTEKVLSNIHRVNNKKIQQLGMGNNLPNVIKYLQNPYG